MKPILFFVFIFTSSISYGQVKSPTKKQIKAFFLHEDPQELVSCNSNQYFFKSDTIAFYNNINYFYQSNECCEFITWQAYKRNQITQTARQICKEPASAKVRAANDYFKIKLINNNEENSIVKIFRDKEVERFKVLALNDLKMPKENSIVQVLTLARVR